MKDWDVPRKRKKEGPGGLKGFVNDTKYVLKHVRDTALGKVTASKRIELDREVRFKVCKFT
jgi:hypothetical protein